MAKFTSATFSIEFLSGLPGCKGASSDVAIGERLDRSPTPVAPGSCKEAIGESLFVFYGQGLVEVLEFT